MTIQNFGKKAILTKIQICAKIANFLRTMKRQDFPVWTQVRRA